ncbi:thiamine phosphate synthase [Robbsia sp. KACC 23696]|uniref:thiamine phosphate synthase n=1 Tax=Robbsia sp. KACC 23696 TaxID=3149231 RepID=UPI00325BAF70
MTTSPFVLPPHYLVTPEPTSNALLSGSVSSTHSFYLAALEAALARGITLVQLRARTLDAQAYRRLATDVLRCCHRHGARLLLNAAPELALSLHADGVHLTSTRLMACTQRPLPADFLVSAACHDETQIRHATQLGVDLLTVSPVLPTKTHSNAIPLGWSRFSTLVALTSVPVYALGGMRIESLAEAQQAGARGIAAIRAFWGEDVIS